MNAVARPGIAVVCATTLVLSVSSCATKKQTGELVGAVVGVAVGAAFGEGSGQVAAATVGFLVGSVVGGLIGERLDEADRQQAEQAAFKVASKPDAGRVNWTSNKNSGTYGYAEPLEPVPVQGSEDATNTTFCFDPVIKVAYTNRQGRSCVHSDVQITEAEFNNGFNTGSSSATYCFDPRVNVAYQLPSGKSCVRADRQITDIEYTQAVAGTARRSQPVMSPSVTPRPRSASASPSTIYCFDPKIKFVYEHLDGKTCAGGDRQISEAEYRQTETTKPSPAPVVTQQISAAPGGQPASASMSCRRVREVVVIDGNESKTVTEYCLRAGQWTRA
jgi:surface antigen